jgi:hypothetical protein
MRACGFQEQDCTAELQSTEHTQLDNICSPINEDGNVTLDSVMSEDLIPLTQLVDVRKSIAHSHLVQPLENVAVPSCSPAQPGRNLY